MVILFHMTAMLMILPYLPSAIAESLRTLMDRREKRRTVRQREITEKLRRYQEIDLRKIR
jgi:hypothetical protein